MSDKTWRVQQQRLEINMHLEFCLNKCVDAKREERKWLFVAYVVHGCLCGVWPCYDVCVWLCYGLCGCVLVCVVVLWFVWCASDVQSDFLGFPPLPSCLVNHADISWFWQIWHIYEAGYLSAQQEQKSVYSISSIQSAHTCSFTEIRLSGYSKAALFCWWWTSGDISWVS